MKPEDIFKCIVRLVLALHAPVIFADVLNPFCSLVVRR